MKRTTQFMVIALVLIITLAICAYSINWAYHNKITRNIPDNYSSKIYNLELQINAANEKIVGYEEGQAAMDQKISDVANKTATPVFQPPVEPRNLAYCVATTEGNMTTLSCKK